MAYYFYIVSNDTGTLLTTGVTADLKRRVEEYRAKYVPGVRVRDHTPNLVYYEAWDDEAGALQRLHEIEGLSWLQKTGLINRDNELWLDLYYELV